jgi:hypothetical protein
MTGTIVRPAAPVSPLNYIGSRGSWATWDGHDWQNAVLPADQLSHGPVLTPDLDDVVQLPSGLYVPGDLQVDSTVYADDVQIKGNRLLSNYGDGYDFESRNISAGSYTTGKAYLGAGVTWTYNAKERLKFTYKVEVELAASNTNNQAEWRLTLFGSPNYTGSVNLADASLDAMVQPPMYNSVARQSLLGVFYMPPGYWPNGSVCYVGISAELFSATNNSWVRNGSGLSFWPASVLKENIGYLP